MQDQCQWKLVLCWVTTQGRDVQGHIYPRVWGVGMEDVGGLCVCTRMLLCLCMYLCLQLHALRHVSMIHTSVCRFLCDVGGSPCSRLWFVPSRPQAALILTSNPTF